MATKAKTLFDTLYEGAKETVKELQKPFVRRTLKMKMRGAHIAAGAEIDKCELAIQDELLKVTTCDPNVLLKHQATIRTRTENQEDIAMLWKKLFDEDFDPTVE